MPLTGSGDTDSGTLNFKEEKMSLVVNSNIAGLNAQRHLGTTNSKLAKSLERLSSGLRINSAADDAAGIAIASKLGSQVRGLNQAVRNANNAITLTQTAEGGLNTVTNILHRLRELAVQSASDDNTASDRANLVNESDNLVAEMTRMVNTTEYNTSTLLDGSFTSKYFQVGANYSQKVTFTIGDARAKSLGGRAQYDANIADGITNAENGGFGASELKINGYGVKGTSSSDDQYSVMDIASTSIGAMAVADSGTFSLMINNTEVDFTISNGDSQATIVDIVVSAINAASITNVSAIAIGSTWMLRGQKGADIELAADHAAAALSVGSILTALGMGSNASMFGSAAVSGSDVINANGQSSAIAKAAAINEIKTQTGVTATAQPNVITGTEAISGGSITSGSVYINGVNLGAVTVTDNDGTGALVSAINNITSSTGVSASTDASNQLVLTAADGRNISLTDATTEADAIMELGVAEQYTNNTAVFRGTVRLTSESEISLTGSLGDLYENAASTPYTRTTSNSQRIATDGTTYNMASVSIDTQANAEAALLTIDAAMNDLNSVRAEIGAVQNRLQFTVANLEISSENLSAAQSRIMDADFASETATFTKNQIMVQAATAILAQANTLPQLALQLLG
jgi:flagellin